MSTANLLKDMVDKLMVLRNSQDSGLVDELLEISEMLGQQSQTVELELEAVREERQGLA